MSRWGSFPRWVGGTLTEFTAGKNAGAHMSALRVYLALALVADFSTRSATISWTRLQTLTGLSRPMVKKGIVTAQKMELIEIDASGHTHSYRLLSREEDATFTQVPIALRSTLAQLPARGFHALDALKVYMTLLTVRGRNSPTASISHKKMAARSGVQPRRIRAAIDVLVNHHLVHVTRAESTEMGHPYNEYHLLGFITSEPAQSTAAPSVGVVPNPSFLSANTSEDIPF